MWLGFLARPFGAISLVTPGVEEMADFVAKEPTRAEPNSLVWPSQLAQAEARANSRKQVSRPTMRPMSIVALIPIIVVVVVLVTGTVAARRRGYKLGGNVIVRCLKGHLFTTIWIPGASLKAVRLGWWRLQRCPVGEHWTLVAPVRDSDLSDEERLIAEQHRDIRMP